MLVLLFSILLVCGLILLFGRRSIKAIPIENLRERLVCAVQYALTLMICLFLLNQVFQNTPFLDEPNDFDTPQGLFKKYYTQIESMKIAQLAVYYTLILGNITFLNLLRTALKAKN